MQVGAPLPLSLQLADRNTGKYVQAFLRDNSGNQIAGSPAQLTPVAQGLYQNLSLSYPNVPFLTVQYIVYDDSGYTTPSTTEGAAQTTFFIDPPSSGSSNLGFYPINLVGVLESEMIPTINGIQDTLIQNSDRNLTMRITNPDGSPFNLSTTTVITCRFLNADMSVLVINSTDGGAPITIINAQQGSFFCAITKAQSALMMPETPVPFSVILTTMTGQLIVNFPYQLSVVPQAV